MIYTHHYLRGFSAWIQYEGYLSIGVLLWKYEIYWNKHHSQPAIDYVRQHWQDKIDAANDRADRAEARALHAAALAQNKILVSHTAVIDFPTPPNP